MNAEFPKLTGTQVAIMRADAVEGDLLDDKFDLFTADKQLLYTVFNTEAEAKDYITKIVKKQRNTEAIVYGANKEVIYYYSPLDTQG